MQTLPEFLKQQSLWFALKCSFPQCDCYDESQVNITANSLTQKGENIFLSIPYTRQHSLASVKEGTIDLGAKGHLPLSCLTSPTIQISKDCPFKYSHCILTFFTSQCTASINKLICISFFLFRMAGLMMVPSLVQADCNGIPSSVLEELREVLMMTSFLIQAELSDV